MHAYLPTLPDPYAANINLLKFQFRGTSDRALYVSNQPAVWLLLIARVTWEPATEKKDKIDVSFLFAPLPDQQPWPQTSPPDDINFLAGVDEKGGVDAQSQSHGAALFSRVPIDYGAIWDKATVSLAARSIRLTRRKHERRSARRQLRDLWDGAHGDAHDHAPG